jgi:hypothetical protein
LCENNYGNAAGITHGNLVSTLMHNNLMGKSNSMHENYPVLESRGLLIVVKKSRVCEKYSMPLYRAN